MPTFELPPGKSERIALHIQAEGVICDRVVPHVARSASEHNQPISRDEAAGVPKFS